MYNNIIEKRTVNDGMHSVVLEISGEEYNNVYEEYSDEIALEILNHHLESRGDDGRPSDVKIKYENHNDMVKIFANLHYLDNDHTS